MNRLILLLCAASCACGGGQVEAVEETMLAPPPSQGLAEAPSDTPPPTPEEMSAKMTSSPPEGHILRADLQRVLGNGPAGVLAMVRTEPARSDGRFLGFRITEFVHETPAAVDLRVGDIVVAINGQSIVSPDDFFRVFQELQVASELRFNILREGSEALLVYSIVDSVAVP